MANLMQFRITKGLLGGNVYMRLAHGHVYGGNYLKLLEVGKSTHYGWHHPLGLRSCTIKSEKSELNASKCVHSLLLTVNALTASSSLQVPASLSCLKLWTITSNCEPFLLELLL